MSKNTETTKKKSRIEKELERAAASYLGIETLETRNSDSLDFHEVAVWQLKAALRWAYIEGSVHGMKTAQRQAKK